MVHSKRFKDLQIVEQRVQVAENTDNHQQMELSTQKSVNLQQLTSEYKHNLSASNPYVLALND